MTLPRWTVYPALALIAGFIVMAVPHRTHVDPFAGAAAARAASEARTFENPPVIVLGIDGMDPDILRDVMRLYPDDMTNFAWLIDQADGIQSLGTSTPPQSPVAWSNFITGMDPGGHGIFDFIHRDLTTRAPAPSTTKIEHGTDLWLPGKYKLTVGADSPSNRTGKAFWTLLAEAGIPADVWRMPINFPVVPAKGVSFPGMMTPAIDSAYGQCTLYTTDLSKTGEYEKVQLVKPKNGRINTSLSGPANPFKEGDPQEQIPLRITIDFENGDALVDTGSDRVILSPGQWSDFQQVDFDLLPMGVSGMGGMVRFYLRSIEPQFELYASPINFDPLNPATTISEPADACTELAGSIGRYYTQGMAEDVNALKEHVLTDEEFMDQVELVYDERRDMLEYALDQYLENGEGGLLFFYFSTVDLACHMMWRHFDDLHPAHDDALAHESSSEWSGRPGSTWADTVYDLYRKMDPVLGRLRERLGDDVTLIVMSDHGFAPYRRKFDLNRWLWENDYLVLKDGVEPEDGPDPSKKVHIFDGSVDWSRTRAYGMGFNGLYLNLKGRELDDPRTPEDESGIVESGEAEALLREIKAKLEALDDPETGLKPVLRCDLATEIYAAARRDEAPDLLVGYNAGYGNSDPASTGRITYAVLRDNTGGTFNGSHLMAPDVVSGVLISNREVREGAHQLQDLTVDILHEYGVPKPDSMKGHVVFK